MADSNADRGGDKPSGAESRRDFLKGSAGAVVGGSLAGVVIPQVHGGVRETIRVGLIGCGGRGTGAARDAMAAGPDIRLVAMGDAFADQLQASKNNLRAIGKEQFAVTDDHCFVGFDAYQKVTDAVDAVLLATPPQFRPLHLAYAVAQGRHAFVEKPVAVDAPGVRSVLATCQEARKKSLAVVSGLCWRYDQGMRETMNRVHGGDVGQIVALQCNYNTRRPRQTIARQPGWSDMEFQLRNWYFYTWLSGDHNVEQHIHSLDKVAWVMGDRYPVRAFGMGGRQAVASGECGQIYDHHAVCYEFENGVRCFSFCRQQNGTAPETEDYVFGSQGTARLIRHEITGAKPWKLPAPRRGEKRIPMTQQEHVELFESIRTGKPINNGEYMSHSTLLAIMGRMATYTGQIVTWEQAMGSQEDLSPPQYQFGPLPEPRVAVPGVTQFA